MPEPETSQSIPADFPTVPGSAEVERLVKQLTHQDLEQITVGLFADPLRELRSGSAQRAADLIAGWYQTAQAMAGKEPQPGTPEFEYYWTRSEIGWLQDLLNSLPPQMNVERMGLEARLQKAQARLEKLPKPSRPDFPEEPPAIG